MSVIINPIEQYFDTDGSPLNEGFLYFGEVYGNPVTQPVMVYFDAEFTIPAAQPVRTVNGYPVRSGTACGLYAPQDVSILVQNKNMEQVIYIESSSIGANQTNTFYRTSDTTLTADDNNRTYILLDSFTQTFDASVALGDRWRVNIINMSDGNITLDPNLSETIDGLASLQLQPNSMLTVYCDGVNLKTTAQVFPVPNIASETALDLRSVKPKVFRLTLNNTINTVQMVNGDKFTAIVDSTPTFTNSSTLLVEGGANYTASANDIIEFTKDASANAVYVNIRRANGRPVNLPVLNATNDPTFSSTSSTDVTSPEWVIGYSSLKAWVNFNGTGTVAIRASRNVSSITDNGTGHYTVNFTTAMPDTNYAAVMSCAQTSTGVTAQVIMRRFSDPPTVNNLTVLCITAGGTANDQPYVDIAIFR